MTLTHKLALDPTKLQAQRLTSFAGVHRKVYNFILGCLKDAWVAYERSGRTIEKPTLALARKHFGALRTDLFPWMNEAGQSGCWMAPFDDLHVAYNAFFAGRAAYPRFMSRHRDRSTFYVTNQKFQHARKRVRIPKIGWVKTFEPLRFVGKIMGVRVVQESNGRWFACVSVEGGFSAPRTGDGEIGVDRGIKHALVTSNSETFEAPKPLAAGLHRLAKAQRVLSRRKKGSNRRERAKRRVAKIHYRIRSIRHDWTHKVTTKLIRENQAIGLETLNIKGMMQNPKLARALGDVSMGEISRQIEYKAKRYGVEVLRASPWYPSTKRCAACGTVKSEMVLGERVYRCSCGHVADRDHNAAMNLRPTVLRQLQATGERPGSASRDATHVETLVRGSRKRESGLSAVHP